MPTIPPGPRAADLRRQLGPTAWCALECLIERSDDGMTATASVRAVAAELGVAKNTAHRAIASLVRAGLVEPTQARNPSGTFSPGRYRLHVDDIREQALSATGARRRQRSAPTADSSQLNLLTGS